MMRSKMKRNKLIFMLVPLLFILLGFLMVPTYAQADTTNLYESLKPKCAMLTDSDVLEGATPHADGSMPTIEDFIKKTNANEYGTNHYDAQEFADRLYKIVPEEFFKNVGEWFYKGYDYSFYIKTWEALTAIADFYSNVVIINNEYEVKMETAEIKTTVSLFSRFYSNHYASHDGLFFSMDEGSTSEEYFLSDVSFTTSIFNEHQLNYGDAKYNKFNDTGLAITQARLNYTGMYNRTTKFDPIPLLVEGISALVTKSDILKSFYDAFSDVNKWVGIAAESYDNLSVTVENGNERNIFTNVTKDTQLKDEVMDSFIRTVNTRPKEPGLLIDESAEMIVLLSDSDARTRVLTGVSYNLYIGDLYDDSKVIHDGEGNYETVVLDSAYAHSDQTDDLITSKLEFLLFEDDKKAKGGENAGYFFNPITEKGEQSEDVFEFVADRNGNYKIAAEIGFKVRVEIGNELFLFQNSWSGRIDFGAKVKITVRAKDSAFQGTYTLNISFTPEQIRYGENRRTVKGLQDEYFAFTPTESKIYSLTIQERNPSLVFRVDRVMNDSLENIQVATRDLDVFLTRGYEYYIIVMNVGMRQQNFTMMFEEGIILNADTPIDVNMNTTKILTFEPSHNGVFTIIAMANYRLDISLYDSSFNKLYSGDLGNFVEHTRFYDANTIYFIEINGYDVDSSAANIEINFTPPETYGKRITVYNILEYNIVKFVPQVSGKYTFTSQNQPSVIIEVYNKSGNNVSGQSLSAGSEYYIMVSGNRYLSVLLEITLSCDRLYNNIPYTVLNGKNTVAFIAPVSGVYSFSGLSAFTVFREDYLAIYNQSSNKISLEENSTYYVEFNSLNANSAVTIYFNPTDLNLSGNVVINNTTYFEINPIMAGEYVFNAQSVIGTNIKLQLYDTNLKLIKESNNQLKINLYKQKYYLKTQVENIDTLLSVTSSVTVQSLYTTYYEGSKMNVNLTGGSGKIFKFYYTKIESKTRYYFNINEVLGENIAVKVYYFVNGTIQTIPLIKTGEVGKYFCDLIKGEGPYYIEVQSANNKVLELNFYVPSNIQDVTINGQSIYKHINSLYMGIGEQYNFGTICNMNATYGAKMRIVSAPSGVIQDNNSIVLRSDLSLVGKRVELAFETIDGNDYRMYVFEIRYPYSAKAEISNNTIRVSFIDLYGKVTYSPVYSNIDFYYYLNNDCYYLEKNGATADLTYLPNIDAVKIYAKVSYKTNNEELISCNFVEPVYSISDNMPLTGKTRLLVDARNSAATQNNKIFIPSSVKNVNIWGKASVVYRSINIEIESRTSELMLNFNNFSFTSNLEEAIKANCHSKIKINITGTSSIRTYGLGKSAINVLDLTISGNNKAFSQLILYGGPQNTSYEKVTAGNGISGNFLTIRGCTLRAYGGNGQNGNSYYSNGYNGANAGSAIKVNSAQIEDSTVYLYGGNGANGINGSDGTSYSKASNGYNGYNLSIDYAHGKNGNSGRSGGNGGSGGDGGSALYVYYYHSIVNSSLYLYGGNSGNGGNGGRGGNGGEGGNAAPTANRPGSDDGGRGGSGGHGGSGGNGGSFGTQGSFCTFKNVSAVVAINGENGKGGQGGNGGNGGNGGKGGDDIQVSGTEGAGGNGGNGGCGGNGFFAPGGNGGYNGNGGSSGNAGGIAGNAGSGSKGYNGSNGFITGSVNVSTSGSGIVYKYYGTLEKSITLYTSNNTGDPYLAIYDSYGNIIAINDDGYDGRNSIISVYLYSYTTYTIVASAYSNGTASYNLNIVDN